MLNVILCLFPKDDGPAFGTAAYTTCSNTMQAIHFTRAGAIR